MFWNLKTYVDRDTDFFLYDNGLPIYEEPFLDVKTLQGPWLGSMSKNSLIDGIIWLPVRI